MVIEILSSQYWTNNGQQIEIFENFIIAVYCVKYFCLYDMV